MLNPLSSKVWSSPRFSLLIWQLLEVTCRLSTRFWELRHLFCFFLGEPPQIINFKGKILLLWWIPTPHPYVEAACSPFHSELFTSTQALSFQKVQKFGQRQVHFSSIQRTIESPKCFDPSRFEVLEKSITTKRSRPLGKFSLHFIEGINSWFWLPYEAFSCTQEQPWDSHALHMIRDAGSLYFHHLRYLWTIIFNFTK